jgi:hypothetical protein
MKPESRQKIGKRRNPKDPPKEHRFKPGKSGNPGGAAKGKRISTWMLELGQLVDLPDPATLPINGRIALARIEAAMLDRGERSTEIIMDRTEGKLTDKPPLPPAEPEMTPEQRAAFEAKMKEYEEPPEIVYCLGCKGIHADGGPDCDYAGRGITEPAPIDPLTGYAYSPHHPEQKYDTKTGREIMAPFAKPDAAA